MQDCSVTAGWPTTFSGIEITTSESAMFFAKHFGEPTSSRLVTCTHLSRVSGVRSSLGINSCPSMGQIEALTPALNLSVTSLCYLMRGSSTETDFGSDLLKIVTQEDDSAANAAYRSETPAIWKIMRASLDYS